MFARGTRCFALFTKSVQSRPLSQIRQPSVRYIATAELRSRGGNAEPKQHGPAPRKRSSRTKTVRPVEKEKPVHLNEHPVDLKEESGEEATSNTALSDAHQVVLTLDGNPHSVSSLLLRDLCACSQCVDSSTRQRNFSTAAIPADVQATVKEVEDGFELRWTNDIEGFGGDHVTHLRNEDLRSLVARGCTMPEFSPPRRVLWNGDGFRQMQDISYEAYMEDEQILLKALEQLYTHGLMFLINVPESEKSVSAIAERVGPLKNTFYGETWDVLFVPQAKNVAYTSQDLGFHMDLLYMKQPPHLQFLHCIRSSSAGGASLFTDSFKAACDLFTENKSHFTTLVRSVVDFHYDHLESNYYRQSRNTIELREYKKAKEVWKNIVAWQEAAVNKSRQPQLCDWIDAISWAPPFQAPFSEKHTFLPDYHQQTVNDPPVVRDSPVISLNRRIQAWHAAAAAFSTLIHRPDHIYDRLMKPGECVIFDNRRVLHARKAFEVGDAGRERWLRGAYVDKDPYLSKLRVLQEKFRA